MFEFGAVLFLASIFPDTLLYASVYALCRSFSVVVLSAWLGEVVDRSDRLWAIQLSIGVFRLIYKNKENNKKIQEQHS